MPKKKHPHTHSLYSLPVASFIMAVNTVRNFFMDKEDPEFSKVNDWIDGRISAYEYDVAHLKSDMGKEMVKAVKVEIKFLKSLKKFIVR